MDLNGSVCVIRKMLVFNLIILLELFLYNIIVSTILIGFIYMLVSQERYV